MYEKTFQSTKLAVPTGGYYGYWWSLQFMQPWDAFLAITPGECARIFRDGTRITFGTGVGYEVMVSRTGGLVAYCDGDGWFHPCFDVSGMVDINQKLNPNWPIPADGPRPWVGGGGLIDDRRRRWVYASGNLVKIYHLDTGTLIATIDPEFGAWATTISWVSDGVCFVFCQDNGKVAFIDYLSMEITEFGRIDVCKVAAYDSDFGVIVGVDVTGVVRVYCRQAVPVTLSAPAFVPAEVYANKANLVRVRLTGQDGEPCPDWWINWTLLGVGGGDALGYLNKYYSKTDYEGYAENLYYGPDGLDGHSKIRASVLVD